MPFEKKPEPKPTKWEVIYEDNESISIWRYNTKKFSNGPIEVEYKWKKGYIHPGMRKKTLGDLAEESKDQVSD